MPLCLVTVINLDSKPVYFPYEDYANNYKRRRGKIKCCRRMVVCARELFWVALICWVKLADNCEMFSGNFLLTEQLRNHYRFNTLRVFITLRVFNTFSRACNRLAVKYSTEDRILNC